MLTEHADAQARKNKIGEKEVAPVPFMTFALASLLAQLASILNTVHKNIKRKHPDISARHLEEVESEITVTRKAAAGLADRIWNASRLVMEHILMSAEFVKRQKRQSPDYSGLCRT